MQLERIEIARIHPNEINPRDDFSSVDRLAENLKSLERICHGEPINPIVVIPDGDYYRIVDGERRYQAMVKNGLESCMAHVCDGWEDADQLLAALATDDKQPLTELEKSRGIQEFMSLGIVEESRIAEIEGASNLKKGTYEKVAAAYARAGEKAYNATLDQLIAAEEFADDPDAYGAIIDAEDDWQFAYRRAVSHRDNRRKIEEFDEIAKENGCEIYRHNPDDKNGRYLDQFFNTDEARSFFGKKKNKGKDLYVVIDENYGWNAVMVVYEIQSDELTEEEILEQEKWAFYERLLEIQKDTRKKRLEWIAWAIRVGSPIACIIDAAAQCAIQRCYVLSDAVDQIKESEIEFDFSPTWQDVITWYWGIDDRNIASKFGFTPAAEDFAEMLSIMEADGYDIGEDEAELRNQIIAEIDNQDDEDPDTDDPE